MTSTKAEVASDVSHNAQPELSTTVEKEELHVVQPTPYEEESSETKQEVKSESNEKSHDTSETAKASGEANVAKGGEDTETAKEKSTEAKADSTADATSDATKTREEPNGAKEDKADESKTLEETTATA